MEPRTEKIIKEMSAIIVEAVNPKRIILFGSQARETARPDSDLDFLIIQDKPFSPTSSRRQQMARLWRLLAHFPVSQDFVVYTEDEVEKWRHTRNHVIARPCGKGKWCMSEIEHARALLAMAAKDLRALRGMGESETFAMKFSVSTPSRRWKNHSKPGLPL